MKIREMFETDDDLLGAVKTIDVLQAWRTTSAHSAAPAEVRNAVDAYLQVQQADVAGLDQAEPAQINICAEITMADVLRTWRDTSEASVDDRPIEVMWAIERALDFIELRIAETVSSDRRVIDAQAKLLAARFADHPLREGLLARSLLASLALGAS